MPPVPMEHLQLLAGPTTSPENQVLSSPLSLSSLSGCAFPFIFSPHSDMCNPCVAHMVGWLGAQLERSWGVQIVAE